MSGETGYSIVRKVMSIALEFYILNPQFHTPDKNESPFPANAFR